MDGDKLTATQAGAIRQAAKNIIYVIANSSAMNGEYTYGLAPWKLVMFGIDGVLLMIFIIWGLQVIRKAGKNPIMTVISEEAGNPDAEKAEN